MKISIELAVNGYVISYPDYISDVDGKDIEVTNSHVVEEKVYDEYGEQEAFVHLCRRLMDLLGVNNSKHNRRRINVELTNDEEES